MLKKFFKQFKFLKIAINKTKNYTSKNIFHDTL